MDVGVFIRGGRAGVRDHHRHTRQFAQIELVRSTCTVGGRATTVATPRPRRALSPPFTYPRASPMNLISDDGQAARELRVAAHRMKGVEWARAIETKPDEVLRLFVADCEDLGEGGQQLQGRRASVVELLEERRSIRIIGTMNSLDEKANRLATVGVWLTAVGTGATVVGVAIALGLLGNAE